MEEIKYTIGLMVDSRREYGANRVSVGVYRREENKSHPLNISADTYGPQRDKELANLALYGWVSETYGNFTGLEYGYRGVGTVHLPRAEAMVAMLKKLNREFKKHENPQDPGDGFMIFARAVGASWFAEKHPDSPDRSAYPDMQWTFHSVAVGRDRIRKAVAEAIADQAARGIQRLA